MTRWRCCGSVAPRGQDRRDEAADSVHASGRGRPRRHLVGYRGRQSGCGRPGGEGIFATCQRLAKHPRMGTKRQDITPLPVRFWTVARFPNYVIVYRPETVPLQVVAVLRSEERRGGKE